MTRFFIRRLVMAISVAFAVSFLSFSLLRVTGDLAEEILGEDSTPAEVEALRKELGLDRPFMIQYGEWLAGATKGNLGDSLFFPDTVMELIKECYPRTLFLSCMGLMIAICLSIPIGAVAALKPESWVDRMAQSVAVFGQAMPSFFGALLLMLTFGLYLRWLPVSGFETPWHFVMPSVTLGFYASPALIRLTRTGMIEVLDSDYIRTAKAKGLSTRSVLFKHALRNAIIPVVALLVVQFGHLLNGSVVIETIFRIKGIGNLAWEAISRMDFPVVQAVVLFVACIYIALVLVGDLLNAWLDPRLRVI